MGEHIPALITDLPGAILRWAPGFLDRDQADRLLRQLRNEIPWEQHHVRLFGRSHPAPRLSCWVGDAQARYRYSGTLFEPRPWTPALSALRNRLNDLLGAGFNSVLANLYRGGADGMGWHADDEPELGPDPLIASLSLGAPRRFLLRSRDRRQRAELLLTHGSLLLMEGATQQHTQHSLPKTARPSGERINLTFRRIVNATPPGARGVR
ncbi:alpha-ketoglutarate-dependent dioxygenase AlkB family protein [Pseudomarimonas salicorniae]|uniref:Alpha-ketoglutarate-dependent dioxygenase AlkB n=1 Tax=Pseudomarimonas salicorniae TaxID=2933270 RepID=A0ABT0GIJ8_9GAMM|nr:alpha-ketoglutarate-dependent dioxygenase AlkB [Lysobacter sp. CAU 1642]MCK7594014.1 alpha-ketoglutarate-dependent dioxygenase AlkB [Lysobacter sp. CAU 1642]